MTGILPRRNVLQYIYYPMQTLEGVILAPSSVEVLRGTFGTRLTLSAILKRVQTVRVGR